MPSRSGFWVSSAWAISSRARRVGHALLGDDLHVRIVGLDRRLEGAVALVGHVEVGVVEDVADLALAAERRGHRVRRLLAHLEQVVRDDRRRSPCRGRSPPANCRRRRASRRPRAPGGRPRRRVVRIDRQREDDRRLLGQHRLDVRTSGARRRSRRRSARPPRCRAARTRPRAPRSTARVYSLISCQTSAAVNLPSLIFCLLVRRQRHLGGGRRASRRSARW